MSIGKGKKVNAQQFYNAINMPVFEIKIKQVCPPYLHILLGIVKRHHDLLEDECHLIDKAIGRDKAKLSANLTDTQFHQYVKKCKKIIDLKNLRTSVVQRLERDHDKIPLRNLLTWKQTQLSKIADLDTQIEKAKKAATLDKLSGPVTSNLETVLQKHKIQIQAYHSRSMVGNHCVKYVTHKVYTDLCESVVVKTKEHTSNDHKLV